MNYYGTGIKVTLKERETKVKELIDMLSPLTQIHNIEVNHKREVTVFVEPSIEQFDSVLNAVPPHATISYEIGCWAEGAGYDGEKDEYANTYDLFIRWNI